MSLGGCFTIANGVSRMERSEPNGTEPNGANEMSEPMYYHY